MPKVLTTLEILDRLKMRVQQRADALERVKLDGYAVALYELRTVLLTLNKAMEYVRGLERKR